MANLEHIKKGDRVIRLSHRRATGGMDRLPVLVESVTAKGIRVGDTWYDKTGKADRGYGRHQGYWIALPHLGELEAYDRNAAEKADQIRREREERERHEATEEHHIASRLSWMEHEKWEQLPIETLRQIADLAKIEL